MTDEQRAKKAAYAKLWYKANKEKVAAKYKARRAALRAKSWRKVPSPEKTWAYYGKTAFTVYGQARYEQHKGKSVAAAKAWSEIAQENETAELDYIVAGYRNGRAP